MPDEPENLTLIYLRRLDAKLDAVQDNLTEMKHRLTTVEIAVANSVATEMNHYASLASRLDRVDARLERVERRLDVIPA